MNRYDRYLEVIGYPRHSVLEPHQRMVALALPVSTKAGGGDARDLSITQVGFSIFQLSSVPFENQKGLH